MRWEHLRSVIARHSKGYQGIKKLVPHILHIRRETPTTQPSGERVSSIEVSVKLCWQLDNCMKNPPTGRLRPLRITPGYCVREGMDSKEKRKKRNGAKATHTRVFFADPASGSFPVSVPMTQSLRLPQLVRQTPCHVPCPKSSEYAADFDLAGFSTLRALCANNQESEPERITQCSRAK
ncbi:hypothetical protein BT96DRAFT_507034 [Gymnopus androsaceus JB14]|uniref:Uncharacterized protein n=1 Tax=Gymnopus androsaceus JB14 TaxID=1447944 RepID=A0A6A4GNC3_9AGAR|nr:hypothetical protein BT96DRAFT_507034 [Gymnopus androsaceus JB14]